LLFSFNRIQISDSGGFIPDWRGLDFKKGPAGAFLWPFIPLWLTENNLNAQIFCHFQEYLRDFEEFPVRMCIIAGTLK